MFDSFLDAGRSANNVRGPLNVCEYRRSDKSVLSERQDIGLE